MIARLTGVLLAFPFPVLAVGLAAIHGASLGNAAVALGIARTPGAGDALRDVLDPATGARR